MPLSHRPWNDVNEADLQVLIGRSAESKRLDFKRELHGGKDSAVKDFLGDVTSFANTAGGYLIWGMAEEQGVATKLHPLDIDPDKEVVRLEQQVRDGVDRRITGIQTKAIPLADGGHAVIMHVPASWQLPHAVTYKGSFRFYVRDSAGKHPINVDELRSLVLLSEGHAERIREFRRERVVRILAGETPIQLADRPCVVVLHLVPFRAFQPGVSVDIKAARDDLQGVHPLGPAWPGGSTQYRFNLDGLVIVSQTGGDSPDTYLQLFRYGALEAVEGSVLSRQDDRSFDASIIEEQVLGGMSGYLKALDRWGVDLPVTLMITLLSVKGMTGGHWRGGGAPIDREHLFLPEILLESFKFDPARYRPAFDALWQAAGHRESPNYSTGEWRRSP